MATKRKKTPPNRPRKKQKRRVPLCSTRPSQSSIDVPVMVKSEVKAGQGNRCWLCGEKFHKAYRLGEIAHVMPQSMTHGTTLKKIIKWAEYKLVISMTPQTFSPCVQSAILLSTPNSGLSYQMTCGSGWICSRVIGK